MTGPEHPAAPMSDDTGTHTTAPHPVARTHTTAPDPVIRAGVIVGLASSVALPLLAWTAPGGPAAAVLAVILAFTATGPGVAALALGHSRSLWAATAPATSLALLMLVSLAQVLADLWSPPMTATILAMIGAFASVEWLRAHRRPTELRGSTELREATELRGPTAVPEQPRPHRPPRPDVAAIATTVSIAAALGLWLWSTATVDLDAAGSTGLIGVLPWPWFASLVLLTVTFAVLLAPSRGRGTPIRHGLLFATAAATAVIVTLTVNVADGGGVFGTGYVHVGFAEAIDNRGALLRGFDARFSWPSFFTAAAVIGAWAGLPDTSPLVIFHPAVIMACYLPTIVVIGRALTGSARVGWLGALLFIFANWGQQDYFSPQSTALLLYLAVIAVVLHGMATARAPEPGAAGDADAVGKRNMLRRTASHLAVMVRRTPAAPAGWTTRNVIAAEALLLLLATALVTQHQLTPVALIIALGAWSLLGRTRHRGLWFGVSVVFAAWFAFGAYDWWTGHLQILVEGIGKPDEALTAGLADRVRGDATYVAMQRFRIGWSAVLAAGAFAGWLMLRGRFPMAAAAVPVIAPLSLVLGQSYGGEMVLRVFLYASPFFAVLTAHALLRMLGQGARDADRSAPGTTAPVAEAAETPDVGPPRRRPVAVGALALVLVAAGVTGITARGVNVAFERTPADVLESARDLLDIAPYRSTVRPLALEGSLRVGRVGEIHHPSTVVDPDASDFTNLMRQSPDYVFLTSTRESYERIVNEAPEGYYNRIAEQMENSGRYRVVSRTDHVILLERNSGDGRALSENPGVGATVPAGRDGDTEGNLP